MKLKIALFSSLLFLLLSVPAFAVDFTDANGREVSVDSPQRVVALYGSYADAWLLSGGQLAGATEDTLENMDESLRGGVQDLGGTHSPNMELLFSLDPDFVILSADIAEQVEAGAILEQAGISCAFFSTPDWRSYMDLISVFTQITGRQDLYDRQLAAVQQPIEALIAEAESSEHFGQSTALLLRANSANVRAKDSQSTVTGTVLRDMGFINLADGNSPLSENLSMEAILLSDPDYIFAVTMGSSPEAALESLKAMFTGNPAWGTLTAVREGRYIILDRELFHYHPNDRWAESYSFIADIIKGEEP